MQFFARDLENFVCMFENFKAEQIIHKFSEIRTILFFLISAIIMISQRSENKFCENVYEEITEYRDNEVCLQLCLKIETKAMLTTEFCQQTVV